MSTASPVAPTRMHISNAERWQALQRPLCGCLKLTGGGDLERDDRTVVLVGLRSGVGWWSTAETHSQGLPGDSLFANILAKATAVN